MISTQTHTYNLTDVLRSCGHIDPIVTKSTVVVSEQVVRRGAEQEQCLACQEEITRLRRQRELYAVEYAHEYCKGFNLPSATFEVWNDGKQVQVSFWIDVQQPEVNNENTQ